VDLSALGGIGAYEDFLSFFPLDLSLLCVTDVFVFCLVCGLSKNIS